MGDQVIGSVSKIETEEINKDFNFEQDSRYSLESQKDGNNLMISLAEHSDEGIEGTNESLIFIL